MTMEEFVTFDIAKKLKEKGFNGECHAYYEPLKHCLNLSRVFKTNSLAEYYNCITAPTISQTLKWLREEKKIYMCIDIIHSYFESGDFVYTYRFYITNLLNHDRDSDFETYETYEKAALAGIEYVLDNLI